MMFRLGRTEITKKLIKDIVFDIREIKLQVQIHCDIRRRIRRLRKL